ncbi:MAG: hypothetical protein GXW99_02185 [Clostridiales bacterium]|nr:hypothetical protein [Clostridiales bacterium]
MFGYVRPAVDKLTEEDKERFAAVYCGLCHTLGNRYGFAARWILNYDFAFLAILLSDETACSCGCCRCVVHSFRPKKTACRTPALELAADESVILSWWQLQDGIADHGFWRGLKYRIARFFLKKAYRKARELRPAFDKSTQQHLAELSCLEKENCSSLDRPADAFAQLLSDAADSVPDAVKSRVLRQMLYHLGRWIYLVDAVDDLRQDAKEGAYNPVALRYGLPDGVLTEESRQALSVTLDQSIRVMAASYELYDFGLWSDIVQSVVYEGMYAVGHSVLAGTFRKRKRKKQADSV